MFREFLEYFSGLWHVSGVSGMFLAFLAHLESFWNGSFWNVSGVLEYVSEVLDRRCHSCLGIGLTRFVDIVF